MKLAVPTDTPTEPESSRFGTSLGESEGYEYILKQWPLAALAYRFPIDRFPVTHQAEVKVKSDRNGIVISIESSGFATTGPDSMEAYALSFMVHSSSTGIMFIPRAIGSFGALGSRVPEPAKTRESWVKEWISSLMLLLRPQAVTWQGEAALDERFHALVTEWLQERDPTASITKMCMHPTYQQIIGMGPSVVPLILRELERDPDFWFWALKAITGEDPVPHASRGKLREMTRAWLRWGREQGYRW